MARRTVKTTRSPRAGGPPAAATSQALKVFTMNIWNFGGQYDARQCLLRAGVQALAPDLLAFQEAGLDGKRDQVRDMLDGLGYRIAHQFDGLAALPRHDGCAIASRWPFEMVERVSLQVTGNARGYPYSALAARVDAPPPVGPLLFVCAKPSWELNREHERELQAVELAKMISRRARREDFPTVVAGDFDATPDSASIRFLTGMQSLGGMSVHYRDAWAVAGDGSPGYTWTYRNGSARGIIDRCFHEIRHERRIDYILVGSPHDYSRPARIATCRVVLDRPKAGVWPSDHYAVYAEIEA